MARLPSVTVFALNIAIVNKKLQHRDSYELLLKEMFRIREPVNTRGDAQLFFGYLAPDIIDEKYLYGLIDRAIDVNNRQWYNEIRREPATDEEIGTIRIPPELKANHREFVFLLDVVAHKILIDNRNRNTTLLPRHAAMLFKSLAETPKIRKEFGVVNITVVQKSAKVNEFLDNPTLKSVALTIRQDNGDQVGRKLREAILDQIREANAQESTLAFTAPTGESLQVTQDLRDVAEAAAESGTVEVKIVEDGITRTLSLSKYPVEATEKYDPRNEERITGMLRAVTRLLRRTK